VKNIDGNYAGRVDIDLSAIMYNKNWSYLEHISYTNLKSGRYQACHSGDITSAPNGASEFIDLHIPSITGYGGRYVVVSLFSYTRQPFCSIPECYAGWMARQNPDSGEIYSPKTVQDKIDLIANTKICIPVIMDLVDRQVVWTDIALTSNPNWQNNVEANSRGMALIGKAMTTLVKPNLYDLFELHAQARGSQVDDLEKADTVFALNKGVTPFDIDKIMSEYL